MRLSKSLPLHYIPKKNLPLEKAYDKIEREGLCIV